MLRGIGGITSPNFLASRASCSVPAVYGLETGAKVGTMELAGAEFVGWYVLLW